jgi:hypothetical protein
MMELDYGMYSPRFGRSDFSNYGYAGGMGGYGAQPRHEPETILSLTMKPSVNSTTIMYMLEAFTARVQLNLQPPVTNDELITAELVTNLIHQGNPDGSWHHVPMEIERSPYYIPSSEVSYNFKTTLMCTTEGKFEFTARIRNNKGEWIWISSYGSNAIIDVLPPSPNSKWTQGPQANEVAPNFFVGNFIAANKAASLGFTAVLNMSEELEVIFPTGEGVAPIQYKKIPVADGASNPIPSQYITQAVDWIDQMLAKGHKVLVHCRAGIGRSGSIGIAYVYKHNRTWSYDQVRKFVWSKKADVYPHKNLYESLSRLYPRAVTSTES